ncbi:uncharacterized protein LOC108863714 [Galendromus occidentalis]|uniref:Uncharacterized protein LOC108863714 n=1 Tax=Galendromus occidentalis TaxID=34638 RepID=A0AAJ7L2G8_9ACAR|nr:uncharacterized protein LOC108863714 [Galendromus occidentalis]
MVLQKCTTPEDKVCAVITYMGHVAYQELHDKIHPERKPRDLTYDQIVSILGQIFEPQENLFGSRIAFRKICQVPAESLVEYEARLRKASTDCRWPAGEELQSNLIEQFIAGLENKQLKQSVLLKSSKYKKLDELFEYATDILMARKAVNEAETPNLPVNFVNDRSRRSKRNFVRRGTRSQKTARTRYRCGDKNHMAPDCEDESVRCVTVAGKQGIFRASVQELNSRTS